MPSFSTFALASALAFAPLAHGHALVTQPTPRVPGNTFKTNCGEQAYNTVSNDPYGNIQNYLASITDSTACQPFVCKGLSLEDEAASAVQSFTPGQTVPMKVDIRAPHGGPASVSVVNTKSGTNGTTIGSDLISWELYGSTSMPIQANQTSFSVTIPDNLGDQCSTVGTCVLRFFWDNPSIDQTYISCIDFTISGSGSSTNATAALPSTSTTTSTNTTATGSGSLDDSSDDCDEEEEGAANNATITSSSSGSNVGQTSNSTAISMDGECDGE